MQKQEVTNQLCLNTTGIGNKVFDEGEDIYLQLAKAIQRIGQGVQRGGNQFLNSIIRGINAAHREKMNTYNEAFVGECNIVIC